MRGLRRREAVVLDANQKKSIAFSLKDADPLLTDPVLVRRVGPDELTARTHFDSREIKRIYRAYKATAPSAVIHRDLMRSIFREFFRRGDVEHYADLVFNAINTSHSGFITFSEYLVCLSMLVRGSLEEKVEWIYRLYDPLDKGYVSCDRVQHVMTAVSDLLDASKRREGARAAGDGRDALAVFQRFQPEPGGLIRKADFLARCRSDRAIGESIDAFRSVIFL